MRSLRRGRTELPPAPFVVGVGRSGTTLLRLMLDAHPELAIPPETHFVPAVIERAKGGAGSEALIAELTGVRGWDELGVGAGQLRERVPATAHGDAATVLRAFYALAAEARGKTRWGDKTPIYVTRMRAISTTLPEARFVHLIRDGRDVALSRRRRGMGEGKPIADTARLWKRRIEDARKQARRLRGAYLELRYEDLLADPEGALRPICELIALDFDPAMLGYHRGASERLAELGDLPAEGGRAARPAAERRDAHSLAAEPPRGDRSGAWRTRMSADERSEFESVAAGLLAELGYDVPS